MASNSCSSQYVDLLTAAAALPAQVQRVVLTLLTTLMRPWELCDPRARVEEGLLVVGHPERRVPLGGAALHLVGARDGAPIFLRNVMGGLGLGELRFACADSGAPFADVPLEMLATAALDHLVRAAPGSLRRSAAFAYAGATEMPAAPNGPGGLLRAVAEDVDTAVGAAGFRVG